MKTLCALLLALIPSLALAAPPTSPVAPAAPKSGFRAEFVTGLADVEAKILDLATQTPADKYNWRPTEGVRSIGEVYMHVAGANYFLASFVGLRPPANLPKDLEKITDKQRVLVELQKSFDHLRDAAYRTTDADLEKQVKMFGRATSQRGVFTTMLNHLHEHLGQSIAYARLNGVVPPWSRGD